MHARHHARARGVDKDRALTAYRLGDQRTPPTRTRPGVEDRGVELHELHVGGGRTRAQRQRQAVRGGDLGVGGCLVQLADTTRGQQHRRGAHHTGHAVGVQYDQTDDRAQGRADRVHGDVVVQQRNPAVLGGGEQRPLDLGARGVTARVHDPERAVAAFPCAGELSVRAGIEDRAEPP
ncbi:hypothetical protein GCM10029964_101490 [Kibdelosporangium lantanae]